MTAIPATGVRLSSVAIHLRFAWRLSRCFPVLLHTSQITHARSKHKVMKASGRTLAILTDATAAIGPAGLQSRAGSSCAPVPFTPLWMLRIISVCTIVGVIAALIGWFIILPPLLRRSKLKDSDRR
jgi:hypothetical protein